MTLLTVTDENDLLYGAHSGIQKAIRRGNLALARQCFNILWNNKVHRNWLLWRLPILVAEETWFLIGEYAQLQGTFTTPENTWSFIATLVASTKNKDAAALHPLLSRCTFDPIHPNRRDAELAIMHKALEEGQGDPTRAAQFLQDRIQLKTDPAYGHSAAQALVTRSASGGMVVDKWLCVGALVLLLHRRLDEKRIKITIARDRTAFKKNLREKQIAIPKKTLPWYVFDKHTRVGKTAMSIFMRNHAQQFGVTSLADLNSLWLMLESLWVPETSLKVVPKGTTSYNWMETVWWPLFEEIEIMRVTGQPYKKFRTTSWQDIKKELINIVTWILQKGGAA